MAQGSIFKLTHAPSSSIPRARSGPNMRPISGKVCPVGPVAFPLGFRLPLQAHSNTAQGIARMQPHVSIEPRDPTVYVDATPLADEHLTEIGRYTARVGMAL